MSQGRAQRKFRRKGGCRKDGTNPRALGTNPRALGMSRKQLGGQVTAEKALKRLRKVTATHIEPRPDKDVWVQLRFQILKRDKFTCTYCGARAPFVRLHVDHVVPHSKGGSSEPKNLVTSCEDCNLGKGAREIGDVW